MKSLSIAYVIAHIFNIANSQTITLKPEDKFLCDSTWLIKSDSFYNHYTYTYNNLDNPKRSFAINILYFNFRPVSSELFFSSGVLVTAKRSVHILLFAFPKSGLGCGDIWVKGVNRLHANILDKSDSTVLTSIYSYEWEVPYGEIDLKSRVYVFPIYPTDVFQITGELQWVNLTWRGRIGGTIYNYFHGFSGQSIDGVSYAFRNIFKTISYIKLK